MADCNDEYLIPGLLLSRESSDSFCTISLLSLWNGVSPLLHSFPCHKESARNKAGTPLHLTLDLVKSEVKSTVSNLPDTVSKKKEHIIEILDDDDKTNVLETRCHCRVVTCCGMTLSPSDFYCLRPLNWLNDQVINCYMKLIMKEKKDVYITTTFFYPKLIKDGFEGIVKWLKKVNMFMIHKLLIPIHLPGHWSLAFIDMKDKKIKYYDSLGICNRTCLEKLQDFVTSLTKHFNLKIVTDPLLWKWVRPKNIPRQSNSSDCGVFVCLYARWICLKEWEHWSAEFSSKKSSAILRDHVTRELKQEQLLPITINNN